MSGKNWMTINSILKAAYFMQIWCYIVITMTWDHFKVWLCLDEVSSMQVVLMNKIKEQTKNYRNLTLSQMILFW